MKTKDNVNRLKYKGLFYKYIAVVLVYRNVEDLKECIESIKDHINSVKIIVVNAYYDEESQSGIRGIADEMGCDFIEIENRGYSYGNNIGISHALRYYFFDYIIVSNPDIVIQAFNNPVIPNADVIAPKIITASGKNQNPMLVKENRFTEALIYHGLKKNNKLALFTGLIINKVIRWGNLKLHRKNFYIFAAHGSFVILKRKVVEDIQPLYDDCIFLFAEEGVLAYRCKNHGFKTVYNEAIVIKHKEDGSMKLADFSISNELKKSNIYFYEQYVKKSRDFD